MPWRHQFWMTASRDFRARPVVAVERPARELEVELRPVGGKLFPQAVEHLERQAAGVGWCLHHDRWHGADEHQLRDPALAVAGDGAGRLAAAGGVTDMDGVAQVQLRDDLGDIGRVVVHVVPLPDLGRPAVAAAVVGDDSITLVDEMEHLRIPIVTTQGPAVVKDDRLRGLRAPVLVEDADAVLRCDRVHGLIPYPVLMVRCEPYLSRLACHDLTGGQ